MTRAALPRLRFSRLRSGGRALDYALYVPGGARRAEPLPLVLFLHGQAESGTDGLRQLSQGLGPALFAAPAACPALVLFPQKPTRESEWEEHEETLLALVERTRHERAVAPRRIALTGLSQGGHGAWVLGARHPRLWSAVAPVCGYAAARSSAGAAPGAFRGGAAEIAAGLRGPRVWAFHGADDEAVPATESIALVETLRAAGAAPRFTLYPGIGHGSWEPAYREPDLPRFLLAPRGSAAAEERP